MTGEGREKERDGRRDSCTQDNNHFYDDRSEATRGKRGKHIQFFSFIFKIKVKDPHYRGRRGEGG
jgi:hypothetical protein